MKRIAILIFIAVVYTTYAQVSHRIRFDLISIKDGLSQSSVNDIMQDEKGFMWFCTQDGLNKFDGKKFTVFYHDPNDSASLADNYTKTILQDPYNNIWIGTDNGLSKFDPKKESFKNFYETEAKGIPGNSVNDLIFDNEDNVWIATNKGLSRFNIKLNNFNPFPQKSNHVGEISSNKTTALCLDKNNNIWVGTENDGLNYYLSSQKRFVQINTSIYGHPDESFVKDIYIDNKNNTWVATEYSLFYIPPFESYKEIKLIPFDQFKGFILSKIKQDEQGNIWVASNGNGLYKIDNKNNVIQYQKDNNVPNSLTNNVIPTLYEDPSGSIWVGTNNGLNKFDPTKQGFKHFQKIENQQNSLSNNIIWSIFESNDGLLWVGSRSGLDVINRSTNEYKNYSNISSSRVFLNNKSIMSVYQLKDNTMVLGTTSGFYKINHSNGNVTSFDRVSYSSNFPENIENKVYKMHQDSRDRIWLGTKHGLALLDKNLNPIDYFSENQKNSNMLQDNTIREIFEDSNGTIWIGTEGGLSRVIENGDKIRFKTYKYEYGKTNSLSNSMVLSIHEDNTGMFWLGTYGGGLNLFDPKAEIFRSFTEKDGLANNVVYSVLADKSNKIWMSSNKGIMCFNTKNYSAKNYRENDGLQSNEFNIGAYYQSKSGELFFGGINGLNAFYPDDIQINKKSPKTVITSLKVSNHKVELGKSNLIKDHISYTKNLNLNHKQNNFTIEFASLHFSNPEKNTFKYKLVNFDEDWVESGTQNMAQYTNLDAGEYTFIVKSANSDGIFGENVASINIVITPPYWNTWWFRIVAILVIVGSVVGVFRARVSIIKAQKEALEKKVQERTQKINEQKEQLENQKHLLEEEKEKSEKLLLNILPPETVKELKVKGKAAPRGYRKASVMFTDFVGFTKISETLSPKKLVEKLDAYFIKFDEIIQKHDIEKIKTIGDAYMCAGGIPIRNKSNPIDVTLAALEIQNFMEESKVDDPDGWSLRIGIHTGEISAGVIGTKRFAYDIWGDTVNVANRMETTCEAGKVNVSGATYKHIKSFFNCEYRGKIDMYFVTGIKPELS